ncbi:translocation/assembly module TamB domain-containing protein [Echinicola sp. CAU 1574]|uniref:Translocation/assembly module TamB domain-containing protein n=1 Tax=Echinicola arenosa TaxID=2774144 RepID=A0ABR9AFS7_9BACT|nr:translocation/assembly module TamB [Echinicola arenosa]MBD8487567.1 translocation/assembly module TamB domain-containing protein [Echinicola arenosa]
MNNLRKIFYKIFKVLGVILLVLMVFIIGILLFVRSPWGQDVIVGKAVSYVKDKTQTEVSIDKLYVTFFGNLFLQGLYVEDQQGDTLVYSNRLETGVEILPLIKNGNIHLTKLNWDGLKANVKRDEKTETFNFDFLIAAFMSSDSASTIEEDTVQAQGAYPEIELGPIKLTAFDLSYTDGVMGIDSRVELGELFLKMEEFDLNDMGFYIREFEFSNSSIFYKQDKPFPATEEDSTSNTPMPLIIIDDFKIENVAADYESVPDEISAKVDLGSFIVQLPEADLSSQKINLKKMELVDSKIAIVLPKSTSAPSNTKLEESSAPFQLPNWTVDVETISMERNDISYSLGQEEVSRGVFNANAISLNDLNFKVSGIYLNEKAAGLFLDNLAFREGSGLDLHNFSFDFGMDDQRLSLTDLDLKAANSAVSGDLSLTYNSIDQLINSPDQAGYSLDLSVIKVNANDALPFAPDLKDNPYFVALAKKQVDGELDLNGSFSNLNLKKANISWGKETVLNVKGVLQNIIEPEKLVFDLEDMLFLTTRNDLSQFVNEADYGVKFPEKLELEGNAKGDLEDLVAELELKMPEGSLDLAAKFMGKDQLMFDAQLQGDQLKLEELLPGMGLGTLTFELHSSGNGSSIEDLSAQLSSDFKQLEYNSYDFSGLKLEGELNHGVGNVKLAFTDENLDMDLGLDLELDSINSHYSANLDLRGANLRALGLTEKDIRARLKLIAEFKGNPESFDATTKIDEGLVVYDERSYPTGHFDLKASVRPDSTSLDISGLMLNGYLRSNASPEQISAGVQRHLQGYLRDSVQVDSLQSDSILTNPVNLDLDLAFKRAPILDQVFIEGLEEMDSVHVSVDFKENEAQLNASVNLPYVQYNDIMLDSLVIDAKGDGRKMNFLLGIGSLDASPLSMGRTVFAANFNNKLLGMKFRSFDVEEQLYSLDAEMKYHGDTVDLHVLPDSLLLNRKIWKVPASNQVLYANKLLQFSDFSFSREGQQLTFSNELNSNVEDQLGVTFKDFQLATIMTLFNPDELLLGGILNGDFIIENPFGATGIVADMNILNLKAMGAELGNLALKAKSSDSKSYDFNLALKDKGIDLDLVGDYVAHENGANLDLNLDINEFKLLVLEELMPENFSEAAGALKGNFKVAGTTSEPKYEGEFAFENAAIKVNTLNSKFSLPTEPLRVDNQGVYFDQVTFKDTEGNNFSLDGTVNTVDPTNLAFDLKLNAQKFQLLNSTREDNDLFYGKANVNADVTISGDMNLPKIDAKLGVNEGTDLTFVIPETQLDIVEREGIVLIVDRDDPNDILTKRSSERTESAFTGMEVKAILEVDPKAIFNVIVDERSGDNLMIAGDADLNLDILPNGQMNLSGIYELDKGHYEMSLYNLVSRKFEIVKGSTISWKGDPMDADLDITASYEVKTSAQDLMATQISGVNNDVAEQYQQRLPFLVYLNVEGELLRPQIFFQLDMPEDEQGALGGNVYTRVQQINEEEGELNRQVFSLLVLQKFMPSTGSDGSGGGTAALARSSVSQMLSSQLNALSSNVLGDSGFELDFDLDSYSGYQGDRTQLNVNASKRLFDDRLIVQVGSQMDIEGSSQDTQNNGAVFGNVNLEYLLTESGRYRIRGFRRNQFESIIDGQLIVTGIAFILNREFNEFRNFWKSEERIERDRQNQIKENSGTEAENDGEK